MKKGVSWVHKFLADTAFDFDKKCHFSLRRKHKYILWSGDMDN